MRRGTAYGRAFGHGWRHLVAAVVVIGALAGASYATAAPVPRGLAASGGGIAYAQAPEWIAAHRGGYGNDASSPGPSVVVHVPNAGGRHGFIEVWAQVRANPNGTAIGLFDVTGGKRRFVDGQDTLCSQFGNVPIPGDLFLTFDGVPGTYGTPMATCAPTTGAPGSVLFRVPAGNRRFKLMYADCGCDPGAARVAHRKLWIRPVPAS